MASAAVDDSLVVANPWQSLRRFTSARIALGRAGGSLPTVPMLEFQLAHARARDAVHLEFDTLAVEAQLQVCELENLRVHSRASDRNEYLQRPDLGRRLDEISRLQLAHWAEARPAQGYDAVLVIADGLSALAVHSHAVAVADLACRALVAAAWAVAPIVIAEQSRVALGDEIGELLQAGQVAILIGERPGLTSPDSLGIYLTHAPRVGRTDAERNCISNIRPDGGLSYERAAHKLVFLMQEARRRGLTGIGLKDDSDSIPLLVDDTAGLQARTEDA
jgi:ethanolamine ammonia-lyase small subunit